MPIGEQDLGLVVNHFGRKTVSKAVKLNNYSDNLCLVMIGLNRGVSVDD